MTDTRIGTTLPANMIDDARVFISREDIMRDKVKKLNARKKLKEKRKHEASCIKARKKRNKRKNR